MAGDCKNVSWEESLLHFLSYFIGKHFQLNTDEAG